jgi:hypothetical protein
MIAQNKSNEPRRRATYRGGGFRGFDELLYGLSSGEKYLF